MKLFLLMYCLVILASCIKVGGKHYSLNQKTVNNIECHLDTNKDSANIHILVMDFDSSPLPGSSVILNMVQEAQQFDEITNSRGEAAFSIIPGTWQLSVTLEGFNEFHKPVLIENGKTCNLRIYLGNIEVEPFQ